MAFKQDNCSLFTESEQIQITGAPVPKCTICASRIKWDKKSQKYMTCNIGSHNLCMNHDCWHKSREQQGLIPKPRASTGMVRFDSGGTHAY